MFAKLLLCARSHPKNISLRLKLEISSVAQPCVVCLLHDRNLGCRRKIPPQNYLTHNTNQLPQTCLCYDQGRENSREAKYPLPWPQVNKCFGCLRLQRRLELSAWHEKLPGSHLLFQKVLLQEKIFNLHKTYTGNLTISSHIKVHLAGDVAQFVWRLPGMHKALISAHHYINRT